ncbi:MAG: glycosyltransferase [Pseudohongiellaceae bacterium]
MPTDPVVHNSPLVSIICRSVGRSELKQALQSVAEQSYRPLEIILVEANQTPLQNFVEYANDVPVSCLSSKTDLPRAKAANTGLGAANGDYIMFLDDDDWIGKDHIKNLIAVLSGNSSTLAAYSNTQKVSADGKTYKEVFQQSYDPIYLMHDNYVPIHSMIFSRKLLDIGCKFDESFEIFEDWDFWLQVNQHTDFAHLPEITAFYREGGDSETKSSDDTDRYRDDNPRGQSRARVFEKWIKLWSGEKLNELLGSLDKSDKIIELSDAIDVLRSSLKDSHTHNNQLSEQATKMDQQIQLLNQHIADLETNISGANEHKNQIIKELEKQTFSLEKQSQALEKQSLKIEELDLVSQKQHTQIEKLTDNLSSEIRRHSLTHDQLGTALESLNERSLQLQNNEHRLEASEKHAAALDTALRSILGSTSWKAMGPYRKVGRFIKRLLGDKQPTSEMQIVEPDSDVFTEEHKVTLQENIEETENGDPSVLADETSNEVAVFKHPLCFYVDLAVSFNNCIFIRGWSLKAPQISKVSANVDGQTIPAIYGAPRSDIQEAYPLVPHAEKSGFVLFGQLDRLGKIILEFVDTDGEVTRKKIQVEHRESADSLIEAQEFVGLDPQTQYKVYNALNSISQSNNQRLNHTFGYQPLISIIVPVFNVEQRWLDLCINSVLAQSYTHWELCLHDDASTDKKTLECLADWATKDARIKVQFGKHNQHISGASNSALEIATGEFIGLMDNDDELHKDALWHVVRALNEDKTIDYIYTDEDKIDENGEYCEPHFKPKWSPELLESMMYVGHFGVVRRSILDRVGGFRTGVEGSQDFDLTLRISQITQRFSHIPEVLYHWRIIPGSVAGGDGAKSYAYDAAVKALNDYVSSDSIPTTVSTTQFLGRYRIQRESGNPSISIILPFHNKADMTIDCLRSIEHSTYQNFEILLISNNSDQSELDKVAAYAQTVSRISLHELNIPFNWSAINNWGIKQSRSEFVLMLNNDMTVINEDWIESLLDYAVKKGVGAVGAKLLYEDDTIQHAGIVMQLGGIASHAFKHIDNNDPGYFGYATSVRNCSAVTGACMLVRRDIALEIDGFNEDLRVAYNDVDFCLRLREANYRVVYTPFAQLYHLESKTRPKFLDDMNSAQLAEFEKESAYIRQRHAKYFEEEDPYYNKALSLRVENYSLRV